MRMWRERLGWELVEGSFWYLPTVCSVTCCDIPAATSYQYDAGVGDDVGQMNVHGVRCTALPEAVFRCHALVCVPSFLPLGVQPEFEGM